MTRYSVQPRDRIFVKDYGFLSFTKNMGKKISKNLSGEDGPGMLAMRQKPLDHVKQSAIDPFKSASKRVIQKTAEATGDLIGDKIANKITKVSQNSQQNNSGTVTNEHDKEIPKEKYIYLQKKKTKRLK